MKRKGLLLTAAAVLAFVFGPPLFAADESGDSTGGDQASAPQSTLTLKGDHQGAFHLPLDDGNDPVTYSGQAKAPDFTNLLGLEYKVGDLKVVLEGKTRTYASTNDWTSSTEFRSQENYIAWNPGKFRFTAGWQVFSWGVADKKNPTDNLNPRDYSYSLDPDKIPVFAGAVAWYPQDWVSIEAVYVPYKGNSLFPTDFKTKTQAGLNSSASSLSALLAMYSVSNYSPTASQTEASYNPSSAVAGGRVNFFLTGWDLSFSYLYDQDAFYTPSVTMANYNGLWLPSKVDLVKKRIHRLGANVKTTIEKYGLWLEAAYNITEDPQGNDDGVRNNKLAWTLGFDFNFGPGDEFYMNLQYAGEWIPGFDKSTTADYSNSTSVASHLTDRAYSTRMTYRQLAQTLGSDTEELLQGITTNLKFPLDESRITPTLTGAYMVPLGYDDTKATRYGAMVLNPEVDLMPADSFHILFGSQLQYAFVKTTGTSYVSLDTVNDKIGIYTIDNNVYLKVKYSWNYELKK